MNKEESLALFARGRDAWNSWAVERLAERRVLQEAGTWVGYRDYADENDETRAWRARAAADFSGQDFKHNADFSGFVFPGDATFERATFSGDVRFNAATFSELAFFGGVAFSGTARFNAATFSGFAGFSNASFFGIAWFEQVTFSDHSTFAEATFTDNALFGGATFSDDALFSDATFFGLVQFNKTTFSKTLATRGADLRRADFRGAIFRGADFRGIGNENTNFQGVAFRGADFRGANLEGINLQGADLSWADFRGADLEMTVIWEADLSGADLRYTRGLSCSKLEEANNWVLAYRDPHLSCGEPIPGPVAVDAGADGARFPGVGDSEENAGSLPIPDPVAVDAAARSTPFGVVEVSSENAGFSLKITPPAKFEWRDGRLHPKLSPAPPDRRGSVVRDVNVRARDSQLESLARLAEDNLATLAAYNREQAKTNVRPLVKDLSGPLECIAREAARPGDRVLAGYLRAKLAVLRDVAATGDEALDSVDRAELRQLLEKGRKLLPFFPELAEIDDPHGAELIPESMADRADEYAEKLIGIVESEAAGDLFSEETGEVLRTERDYKPLVANPEDRILQQRDKLARFGGMAGEMNRALENAPPSIHTLGSFASIAAAVKDLWNLVKPYLGF